MGDSLRFPVFLSSLTPSAVDALKHIHQQLPNRLSGSILLPRTDSLPSRRFKNTGATTFACYSSRKPVPSPRAMRSCGSFEKTR